MRGRNSQLPDSAGIGPGSPNSASCSRRSELGCPISADKFRAAIWRAVRCTLTARGQVTHVRDDTASAVAFAGYKPLVSQPRDVLSRGVPEEPTVLSAELRRTQVPTRRHASDASVP